ncbi:unnamed protein product [Closterium sp. NIES-53]
MFRVWGSCAFVRDTSTVKLSPRAIPYVFLGFVPDAPGWQFYHPTSRCVFPSQDVTFDKSVPFYHLFPYQSAPPPPPLLFLALDPPPVDPLPPQGPAPSGVSHVDPLPRPAPVVVAVGSGALFGGARSGGAERGGEEPRGAELVGVDPEGVEPGGAESEGAESGGVEPRGAASSGGPACASPRLSPQQLREWFVWRACPRSGATGAGGSGDAGDGGARVPAGAGGIGGTAATGPGHARTRGTRAAGTGGVESAGAGSAGAAGPGVVDPEAGGARDTVLEVLETLLHEEIWLCCPPRFTESFPAGTLWSLRWPVYGLRQAPREWHDTLRTTLVALGFAHITADPSLFLHVDTSLPPFYVLVYVLQRLDFQFSLPQPTPLSTSHLLSAPPLDESIEPSRLYLELVGCLMYLMTCTRPYLAYPLSLLARYVAPVRWAWGSCLEDGVQLASPVTKTLLGSSFEAEIYAGAMAAQELCWLTYLLTDLGEQPRSPPVLYVDNKAMIALCHEHRLEHRTKHNALRYFLARELQQRGQLRLEYVATRANTADIFTKALPPACFAFLDWSCDHLFSPTLPMGDRGSSFRCHGCLPFLTVTARQGLANGGRFLGGGVANSDGESDNAETGFVGLFEVEAIVVMEVGCFDDVVVTIVAEAEGVLRSVW